MNKHKIKLNVTDAHKVQLTYIIIIIIHILLLL